MKELLLGGLTGLALGIALQWLHLHRRDELRWAVGLLAPANLRGLLLAVGLCTMLTALLMWLAVIDVDTVSVPPLDGGTLLGALLFGAALGWSGLTPATAGAVLGADRFLEGLCAVAGCVAGAFCLRYAQRFFPHLRGWLTAEGRTWFQVTLDKPFLLGGGFLGQGCLGLLITVAALFIRRVHEDPLPPPQPEPVPLSDAPADVHEDAFVVNLPGEEPVVVDTAQEPADPDENSG